MRIKTNKSDKSSNLANEVCWADSHIDRAVVFNIRTIEIQAADSQRPGIDEIGIVYGEIVSKMRLVRHIECPVVGEIQQLRGVGADPIKQGGCNPLSAGILQSSTRQVECSI